jgi:glycosyltransferase involved in cell wall biosynthesis
MRTAFEIVFWLSAGLLAWTQVGYGLFIAALARTVAPAPQAAKSPEGRTANPQNRSVSLIVAAHDEQEVIGAKVKNALGLDYPRHLFELIVACDGCGDATAARARAAGADLVLELPRGGKIAAQDAAVESARGEIVAFSDANALWESDALRELVGAFEDPRVGYACGRVRFMLSVPSGEQTPPGARAGGRGTPSEAPPIAGGALEGTPPGGGQASGRATNQEGVYWRYEMALRERESRLSSVTAGNGAIYATRRDSYIVVDPIMGHDLSFPFNMVKRGWRAVDVPGARASEKMVPSIEGEWRRKRRMMSHTWPIVVRGGMLSPRGYTPGYALMILSHRLLRYLTPFLHLFVLLASVALATLGAGALYWFALLVQATVVAGAALAKALPLRPLLIARYYVLTAASPAAGLWDWLRHGTDASWEAAEGTR